MILPGATSTVFAMIGTALLVLALLVWAEFRRPNRQRRGLRVLATVLAVASLLMIGLRPRWPVPQPRQAEAVLVTPGATTDALRRFADSLGTDLPVFSLIDPQPWAGLFGEVERIPDAAYLGRHHADVGRLYVVGDGLHGFDWAALPGVRVTPLSTPRLPGIQAVRAPREVVRGASVEIQGTVAGDRGAWLYLEGPEGLADSLRVDADRMAFALRTRPRAEGQFVYTLRLVAEGGAVWAEESLGVSVMAPPPLSLLVLEAAPRFETRHLRDWLARRGGALAVRAAISRDRYRTEVLNLPALDLSRLTTRLLRRFDVLLIDGATLRALSPTERTLLRTAVAETGLGVLVAADTIVPDAPRLPRADARFFQTLPLRALAETEPRSLRPTWEDIEDPAPTPLPARPFVIEDARTLQGLMTDEERRLVAAYVRRGRGRVGVTLLTDTYRWVLQGYPTAHAAYWSHLLSALARPDPTDRWDWPTETPPRLDHPLALTLTTTDNQPRAIVEPPTGAPVPLALRRALDDPNRWTGTFWPEYPGWHRTTADGGDAWFFVPSADTWAPAMQTAKIRATALHAERRPSLDSSNPAETPLASEALPRIGFFLAFLLSCAYLWIERKL